MDSKTTPTQANQAMPTDQGLQQFSPGINNGHPDSPLFSTLAMSDDTGGYDSISGVNIPSQMSIDEARAWVEISKL